MVLTVESHRTIPSILGSPEYQVIAQGIPRGGFSVDRPRLPTEVENEIVDKLVSRLAPEREPQFRAHLRLMFASFVEVHKAHGAYRVKQFGTESDSDSLKRLAHERREKATTRVARRLKTHERRCRRLRGQTHVAERQLRSFFRRLTRDTGVSGALNAVLVKKCGWSLNQYRHPEMRSQVFRELEEALQVVKDDLSAAVKTGREEPVLNQLCQSLLALIENMTGKCPGRSNIAIRSKAEVAKLAPEEDDDKQREGGYFLEICRLMTAAVYDALPVAERPSRNRDMVKLVRNATQEHSRTA